MESEEEEARRGSASQQGSRLAREGPIVSVARIPPPSSVAAGAASHQVLPLTLTPPSQSLSAPVGMSIRSGPSPLRMPPAAPAARNASPYGSSPPSQYGGSLRTPPSPYGPTPLYSNRPPSTLQPTATGGGGAAAYSPQSSAPGSSSTPSPQTLTGIPPSAVENAQKTAPSRTDNSVPSRNAPGVSQQPWNGTPPTQTHNYREIKTIDDMARDFMRGSPYLCPPSSSPSSVQDLMVLAHSRAWSRVIKGASYLQDQGLRGDDALEVRLCRALAFLRLRRHPEAKQEIEKLVNLAQSSGIPVRFATHLIAAELKGATSSLEEAADSLTRLAAHLERHISQLSRGHEVAAAAAATLPLLQEEGRDDCGLGSGVELGVSLSLREAVLWRRYVLLSLSNNFLQRGVWRASLSVLSQLASEVENEDIHFASSEAIGEAVAELYSRIGRIFLMVGDIRHAREFFERSAETDKGKGNSSRVSIDASTLAIAEGKMKEASILLEDAASRLRGTPIQHSCAAWGLPGGELLCTSVEADPSPWVAAANNLSIAAVYLCDVPRALNILEDMVRQNPAAALRDATVFNLCTLYDLSCDSDGATLKKRVLEAVARHYCIDDITRASYRLDGE